jgi:hypothetical protein
MTHRRSSLRFLKLQLSKAQVSLGSVLPFRQDGGDWRGLEQMPLPAHQAAHSRASALRSCGGGGSPPAQIKSIQWPFPGRDDSTRWKRTDARQKHACDDQAFCGTSTAAPLVAKIDGDEGG